MSKRSAADVRAELEGKQEEVMKLLAAGRTAEFVKAIVEDAKKGMGGLLDLDYRGRKVRDVEEFKDAKKLTDRLFKRIWDVFKAPLEFPVRDLILFGNTDYNVTLYQGMDVAGVFNNSSAGMDGRLKAWFVLGFYAYAYELAGKAILSYVGVFPTRSPIITIGSAIDYIKNNLRIPEMNDYFDPFLRNSVNHSEYIVTDFDSGTFEAWNTAEGVTRPKRQYDVNTIFKMTVGLIFFVIAYYCSHYETVIKLDQLGAFR